MSALWCRYCYGETRERQGDRAERPELGAYSGGGEASAQRSAAFLELRHIFGELADEPSYVPAFSDALSALWARGVRSTLADYLSDKS